MPLTEELRGQQFGANQDENANFQNIASALSIPLRIRNQIQPQGSNIQKRSPKTYGNIEQFISDMGTITTPFMGSTRSEAEHPGIDIANKIGTAIKAFAPGVVKEVVTGKKQGDKAYGNYVVVEDPYGAKHRYSHLSQSYVRVGDRINAGDDIASMGATGNTYSTTGGTGSHLDYRIRDAAGIYLNPYSYLAKFLNS